MRTDDLFRVCNLYFFTIEHILKPNIDLEINGRSLLSSLALAEEVERVLSLVVAAESFFTSSVVFLSLIFITKNFVGIIQLLIQLSSFFVALVLVWMMFDSELPVSFLNLSLSRRSLHSKDLVEISAS